MHQPLQNFAALGGRLLLATIFIVSGFKKLGNFPGTATFVSSAGLPAA